MEVTNDFNWNAALSSMLSSSGIGNTQATGSVGAEGKFVLTVTDKVTGRTVTQAMDVPELDESGAFISDEGKEALLAKLEEMGFTATAVDQMASNPSVASLLFDMSELMKLMQEIAQQQRDNAREARSAQLETEIASIKEQAAIQRKSAVAAFATSVCATIVQVGVTCCAAGIKGNATKQQETIRQEMGIPKAEQQLKTLTEAMKNPQLAVNESNTAQGNLTQNGAQEKFNAYGLSEEDIAQLEGVGLDTKLNDACKAADADVVKAQADLTKAKSELETLRTQQNQAGEEPQNVQNNENQLQPNADEQRGNNIVNEEVEPNQAPLNQGNDEIIEDGNQEGNVQQDVAIEQNDNQAGIEAAEAKVHRAETDLAKFEQVQKAVHARSTEVKATHGMLKGDVNAAQENLATLDRMAMNSAEWRALDQKSMRGDLIMNLNMACRSMLEGLSGMVKSNIDAEAAEYQVIQKQAESRYEDLNEMMRNAKELISTVIQLFQAVIQAESQATEQVIRA